MRSRGIEIREYGRAPRGRPSCSPHCHANLAPPRKRGTVEAFTRRRSYDVHPAASHNVMPVLESDLVRASTRRLVRYKTWCPSQTINDNDRTCAQAQAWESLVLIAALSSA